MPRDSSKARRGRAGLGALLVCASLLTACEEDPSKRLVGRWQLVDDRGQMVIEFREDGTYSAASPDGLLEGHWSLAGDGEIATWTRADRPKRINAFRLVDGDLIIVDRAGGELLHRAVE